MSVDSPGLEDLLLRLGQMIKAELHVAIPATVNSYDTVTGRLEVQPNIRARRVDDEGEQTWFRLPAIQNVPIAWPRGGGGTLTFPIDTDDQVLLVCCDRSIGEWSALGGNDVEPQTVRLHDLDDAVAIAGVADVLSDVIAPDDRIRLAFPNGARLELTQTTNKIKLGRADTGADLLQIVYDLMTLLSTMTYLAGPGPATAVTLSTGLAPVAFDPLKTTLDTIKE